MDHARSQQAVRPGCCTGTNDIIEGRLMAVKTPFTESELTGIFTSYSLGKYQRQEAFEWTVPASVDTVFESRPIRRE